LPPRLSTFGACEGSIQAAAFMWALVRFRPREEDVFRPRAWLCEADETAFAPGRERDDNDSFIFEIFETAEPLR